MDRTERKLITIVAAHPLEVRELQVKLASEPFKLMSPLEFLFEDIHIRIVVSGVGRKKVESALHASFQGRGRPSALVNIGFAGALQPRLAWGDWILCDRIYCLCENCSPIESFAAASLLLEEVRKYFATKKFSFEIGSLVTIDEVCSDEKSKQQLFKETKALAIDMEAFSVAQVACRCNLPFLSVKIVSDALGDLAEDAIKSRGRDLSCRIAETMPDLIARLAVSLNESKRGDSYLQ